MMRSKLLAGVASLTPLALALSIGTAHATNVCDPLNYGAVGDGTTDNTTAIQTAINNCASAGGGMVPLSKISGQSGTYLTAPIVLKSHVILQLNAGVTLLGTNDHSKYKIAYINWPWQAGEALVSAGGQTDVGIIGSGTIDGQGGQLASDGGHSWWYLAQNYTGNSYVGSTNANGVSFYTQTTPINYTYIPSSNGMPRPWLVEFYNCTNVTVSGVTLKNSPMWHTVIRSSKNVTISGITVNAPAVTPTSGSGDYYVAGTNALGWTGAKNSDAIDLIGAQNVTISNATLSVNDDNIAMKAFFPLNIDGNPADPLAAGLVAQNTTNVTVTNMKSTTGHGFSIGSETGFGVDHVLIQNVTMNNTTGNNANFSTGIRLKSGRDRGSQLHHLTFQNITMNNVAQPLTLQLFYPGSAMPQSDSSANNASLLTNPGSTTANTPFVHDVTISNVTATNASTQSNIEGLPESCMLRVNLNNISIAQAQGVAGLSLANVTGTFNNVSVTTAGTGFGSDSLTGTKAAFEAYQNVSVTATNGTNGGTNLTVGTNQLNHTNYSSKLTGTGASNNAYYSTACSSQNQQTGS